MPHPEMVACVAIKLIFISVTFSGHRIIFYMFVTTKKTNEVAAVRSYL